MKDTKIEWCHHSLNPWRGCTKVSPGCQHCYAETLSKRNPGVLGIWGDKGTRVVASESAWREPLKWDRAAKEAGERHRVFCASLADVFEDRPELVAPRVRLFHLINETPNLDWLLLTKRPQNIRRFYGGDGVTRSWSETMPPNVWIGTSVENQAAADERIPHLLEVPATVRFLSMEPLLGPVDLRRIRLDPSHSCTNEGPGTFDCLDGRFDPEGDQPFWVSPRINWVIVGGESGPGARPMHPNWVRSIRDQCNAAEVAFHFKQWGEWRPDGQGIPYLKDAIGARDAHRVMRIDSEGRDMTRMDGLQDEADVIVRRLGKKAAGRMLDGRTWDELPQLREATC